MVSPLISPSICFRCNFDVRAWCFRTVKRTALSACLRSKQPPQTSFRWLTRPTTSMAWWPWGRLSSRRPKRLSSRCSDRCVRIDKIGDDRMKQPHKRKKKTHASDLRNVQVVRFDTARATNSTNRLASESPRFLRTCMLQLGWLEVALAKRERCMADGTLSPIAGFAIGIVCRDWPHWCSNDW